MPPRARAIVLVVVLLIAVTAISLTYAYFSGTFAPTAKFTILITNQGFNGSRNHSDAWPVITVKTGDRVLIHVVNDDTLEPHGFAITHYFNNGVTLRPGESHDVSFIADETGSFRIYCDVFCSIHYYMQNGTLIVTG